MVYPHQKLLKSDFVDDLNEENVGPASIDVTLANEFLIPEQQVSNIGQAVPPELLPPQLRNLPMGAVMQQQVKVRTMDEDYECRKVVVPDGGKFIIGPKDFVLGRTVEYIKIPKDCCMFVEGRSSVGRMGLFIHNAGFTDPGFEGTITLELFNASNVPIALEPGRRIAQFVVISMGEETDLPYKGKYFGQVDTTNSMIYKDSDAKPKEPKISEGGIHLL